MPLIILDILWILTGFGVEFTPYDEIRESNPVPRTTAGAGIKVHPGRIRMNRWKRMGLVLLTVLVMAAVGIAMDFFYHSGIGQAGVRDGPQSGEPQAKNQLKPFFDGSPTGRVQAPVSLKLEEIRDTATLTLIGPQYAAVKAKPELTRSDDGTHRYRKDIGPAVDAFLALAEKKDRAIEISSAYRTESEQAALHEEIRDRTLVQPPGHSEHQTGLALDLQPIPGLYGTDSSFAETIAFLEKNAARFGFIQRYPEGSEDITGIQYEYWHYRYVGEPHAGFMAEHGLTLEEYLELLAYKGQLVIQGEKDRYRIYWKEPVDGEIRFYPGEAYEISSTNTGAYIVTVTGEGNE